MGEVEAFRDHLREVLGKVVCVIDIKTMGFLEDPPPSIKDSIKSLLNFPMVTDPYTGIVERV